MSRIIKRYENRKLYDTENRKYISLEEIAGLIRDGVDVQIIDNVTNKDITTHTLTQVIFEEGKKGRNPLTKENLHDVIRLGSEIIDDGIEKMRSSLDKVLPASLNKLFGTADAKDINTLKKSVDSLEELIHKISKHEIISEEENSDNKE